MTEIRTIGVIGLGAMGGGIAEVCALWPATTRSWSRPRPLLAAGPGLPDRVKASLDGRPVAKGKLAAPTAPPPRR